MTGRWLLAAVRSAIALGTFSCSSPHPPAQPPGPPAEPARYTLSGNTSGLRGSGLTLSQGAQQLAIDRDGPFTFAAPIADGASYAVYVATAPAHPQQSCSVANGSGVIAGREVTDLEVRCTTDSFAVSGTVTGLAGAGLVLTNNRADDLTITLDGPFRFPAALEDGTPYDVGVAAQPTGPEQECFVSSGAGVLDGAEITDVRVECLTIATIAFAAAAGYVSESAGSAEVLVRLSLPAGVLARPVSVELRDAASGTATAGSDYEAAAPLTVTFPAGAADGAIQAATIALTSDDLVEGEESVDLELAAPSALAELGGAAAHTLRIGDDDVATVAFVAAESDGPESGGGSDVLVELTLPAGVLGVAVSVELRDGGGGTATSGSDYEAVAPTTVTFPAGTGSGATRALTVGIRPDDLVEGGESVRLILTNPSASLELGAQLEHTVRIDDDDRATVAFATAAGQVSESAGSVEVLVGLSLAAGVLARPVSVELRDAASGTATAGSDYEAAAPLTVTDRKSVV
jgi:hypothetical protein